MKTNLIKLILLMAVTTGCGKGSNGPGSSATPALSFDDVSAFEGNGGTTNLELKLTLDQATSRQVSVTYTTIEGTAKAGSDYTAVASQTITFQPNEKEKKIIISVVADDIRESDETFLVRVQDPLNVNLTKGTAVITLKNDDTKVPFTNAGFDAPATYPGYTLAWGDEFNSNTLDAGTWSNESGDGCPGLCGWGNNELQYYTAPPNNLFFQDGKMIIEAKAETFGGKNYTSSRIKTQGKKSFKFGRVDVRALLPRGKGIWPALWLMPQDNVFGNWPRSGEIDMMEYKGQETNRILGTVHFGPGPASTYITKNYTLPSGAFTDQFHVFSLEWEQDAIRWYVDNTLYATITKADITPNNYPFNESFYFIINMAVGGNFLGDPDATTVFPQWFIIDYIRVHQK